jgi:hypothetical protein
VDRVNREIDYEPGKPRDLEDSDDDHAKG